MMSTEYFVVYNILMVALAWYLWRSHGIEEYDNGFMDAVQLHKEGRLTYFVEYDEEGYEVINIEVDNNNEK